jgi:hypothetical protein
VECKDVKKILHLNLLWWHTVLPAIPLNQPSNVACPSAV